MLEDKWKIHFVMATPVYTFMRLKESKQRIVVQCKNGDSGSPKYSSEHNRNKFLKINFI